MKTIIILLFLLLCIPFSSVNAAILVFSPNGTYVSKPDLSTALTSADTVGKKIVLTTPNYSVTTALSVTNGRTFDCQSGGCITFSGSGSLTGLTESRPEWFGAQGDGVTNDTAAFNAAIASSPSVTLSAKTYLVNAVTPSGTGSSLVLKGAGTRSTILKPYNQSQAILTINYVITWVYNVTVSDIQFEGIGNNQASVGVTFGTTVPGVGYTSGMENYGGNTTFRNCAFIGLLKGVQFPYGNIGSSFYNCGFTSNFYGVYSINAKFGGTQQAGLKYFYDSEFDNNLCAMYINDAASIDTGAVTLTNTTLEYNKIAIYVYNVGTMHSPITLYNCWIEGNGALYPFGGAGNVALDYWTGTTLYTSATNNRTFIFDGTTGDYVFNGTNFIDCYVKGTNINVEVNESICDGSYPSTVTDATSSIILNSPRFADLLPTTDQILSVGRVTNIGNNVIGVTGGNTRWWLTEPRKSKITSYGANYTGFSASFVSATTITGAAGITGTTPSDGVIFSTCNDFVYASMNSTDFVGPTTTSMAAGWFVFTADLKVMSGNPTFVLWDRSTNILASNINLPTTGKWYTVAGMGYASGAVTLYFDTNGPVTPANVEWRMSAYQILRFDTKQQAQSYLAGGVYAY